MNSKQYLALVASSFSILAGVTVLSAAASAETFVISNSNKALNTNSRFRLIDGHPRMAIWTHNINDAEQNFDRLQGARGGQLLRHRSTGKCLNAYRRWNGAEVNVYPCNANDPDQNFNVENLSNGDIQIRLSEIRNNVQFCIDSPTRNDGGTVTLWQCNSGVNQRFKINGVTIDPNLGGNQLLTLAQFNNWSNMPEFTSRNPFPSKGKNCTWYAYGRMLMLGFKQSALNTMLGNAGTWDNTAGNGAYVSATPQVGSIVVWEAGVSGAGNVGHVAVVEKVNSDNTILISESNWAGQAYNTRTISRYAPSKFIIVPR